MGPVVNGLLVGLPLTTGPVSILMATQYGADFAVRAVAGNLAGQVAMAVFCLSYSAPSWRTGWKISAPIALCAFMVMTLLLNAFTWELWPAFGTLLGSGALAVWLIPQRASSWQLAIPPRWDLPARIIVGATFVVVLTSLANGLGPQLRGLISNVPLYGVVSDSFTHAQQEPQAASNLLRGIILGSVS